MKIPKNHPRFKSLEIRTRIEEGAKKGITSYGGLLAHGRGEAFDYLLGEKTHAFSREATKAAAAKLLIASHPVISVNGNAAALVPQGLIELSNLLNAPLEINLFHTSISRMKKIKNHLTLLGAKKILLPQKNERLPFLSSNRKFIHKNGIGKADVVFVPLEDGDRALALRKAKKDVITIDLNPLSRTSVSSSITIVDNIVRAIPSLVATVRRYKQKTKNVLREIAENFDNEKQRQRAIRVIRNG